jgi:uncharacterized membrane protein YGL010W
MKSIDTWLKEYASAHRHPTNARIHKVCVPLITWSTLGLLWSVPMPAGVPWGLNAATLLVAGSLLFYALLDAGALLLMAAVSAVNLALVVAVDRTGALLPASAAVFVAAWVVQLYGHKVEGSKPSFIKDLAFLLIGPVWVARSSLRWLAR